MPCPGLAKSLNWLCHTAIQRLTSSIITSSPVVMKWSINGRSTCAAEANRWEVIGYLFKGKVFVIFHGPNAYISPNVYQSSQLPTWNSISVHLKGVASTLKSAEAILDSMINMISFLEKDYNPFTLSKNDRKVQSLIGYVVGFEIEILEMIGRFKLSQNKNAVDRSLAKKHLITDSKKGHSQLIDFII